MKTNTNRPTSTEVSFLRQITQGEGQNEIDLDKLFDETLG